MSWQVSWILLCEIIEIPYERMIEGNKLWVNEVPQSHFMSRAESLCACHQKLLDLGAW